MLRRMPMLVALLTWQLLCLAFATLFTVVGFGALLADAFGAVFGDVQRNYAVFYRVAVTIGLLVITLPATCLTLWVFGKLTESGVTRCRYCGSVLKGLAKPVCPACGEKI